jgi:hypothetical protein
MMEQAQSVTVNDALKALSDYRAAAGIRPVKARSNELSKTTGRTGSLELIDTEPAPAPQPRLGRYVNIWA